MKALILSFTFTLLSLNNLGKSLKNIKDVESILIEKPWQSFKTKRTGLVQNSYCLFEFYKANSIGIGNFVQFIPDQRNKKKTGRWQINEKPPGNFRLILKYDLPQGSEFDRMEFNIINPYSPEEIRMELIPQDEKESKMKLKRSLN